MITISAFKWVPDFAQGQVRDLRARWALEEAGMPYRTRLIGQGDQDKPEYRALQPFGQVPILEEDGHVLFESGAIVLYVDGVQVASGTGGTAARTAVPNITFGRQSDPSGSGNPYAGYLDEVSLYNTVLSAATVAGHHNAGAS